MKYRKLGNSNFEISTLSLGAQRILLTNKEETIKIIHYAIDHGVNYFNLGYLSEDCSETMLKILKDLFNQYGDGIRFAVNIPVDALCSSIDFNLYLERKLRLLQIKKIDFCILSEFNRNTWLKTQKMGMLDQVDIALEEGKIGNLGFSFHDDFQILREIINAYKNWSFCQFQYNYMDFNHHPGFGGIKYAAEKGLGVIVTNPFKDGRLIKEQPKPVNEILSAVSQKRSLVEWCLRWIWNHPDVSTVTIDIDSFEQVAECIALANDAEPNSLTIRELVAIERVREFYLKLKPINCANCGCCLPCPLNIDIPRIFELYNDAIIYNDAKTSQMYYSAERHNAANCIECGKCIEKCPRKINITFWLKKAHNLLST